MDDRLLLFLILLTAVLARAGWHWRVRPPSGGRQGVGRQRGWHPRTPDDCPCCRGVALDRTPGATLVPSVRPWAEIKSRRGAPKRQPTAGYACPTPTCPYFGIADERIHALIAYGHHGTHERIPDLCCQACGTKFTARHGTALYRLKTPSSRVGEVLSALAEGLDVGAAVRVFGYREATIARWLNRAGEHAGRLHDALLRDLYLPHLQLDEIRTCPVFFPRDPVSSKRSRLPGWGRGSSSRAGGGGARGESGATRYGLRAHTTTQTPRAPSGCPPAPAAA
jgi:hypothetical protein